MVQLSLLEEVKDKASRLIPTAYMEIVEECTAPHLLIPTYEHVKFLCETVNKKPDVIVDVVRALRRRIADNDVAVKHLTVQLLESLVKNSATAFHVEVASQKGLLRDLVNVACIQPTTGRAMQAKEAALLLTLNLSIWFRGHPAEECYILTTLADDVRNQLGPNCFEGIEPERNTRVRVPVSVPPPAASRASARGTKSGSGAGGRAAPHRQEKRNVVDAIPIDLPTPERVSTMLDVCMTFSEYLNNTEMNTDKSLTQDEVVKSYLSQVKEDHNYVTVLLSSNLQLDRDVLRTVGDSQSAVLKKVEELSEKLAGRPAAPPQTLATAVPVTTVHSTPLRSAGDVDGQPQRTPFSSGATPAHATPPRAEVAADGNSGVRAPVPPPQVPAPSVDDLFGDAVVGPSVSSSNALEGARGAQASTAAAEPSGGSSEPASPPSLNQSVPAPLQSTNAVAPTEAASTAHVDPAVAEDAQSEPAEQREHAAGETAAAEREAPKEAKADLAAVAPPAAEPPKDDDDFDAFLEGRMSS
ncbi:hypothetical protein ABB37_03929 [Leptomonas pyrrhocoris]|uniref:VHS domain-containing protein n=1 Tax=Leptomonas pyrrhocoris TaxID=157538 RepID=A0A0M9G3P1_LEPPY|nr:hypothetical protein ABB37_03929 [Leptomonas pyrrhocoris]KPA81593.1 hypothetical protein ABB37_03929 [Leptomonas pyrrhocoris]|eukprot:XP_015660032.1 hypothetical protein ABB37_03929 [Leptomonas pyrrhocoris]